MAFSLTVPTKYHNAASIIASLNDEQMGVVMSFLKEAAYPFSPTDSQDLDYSSLVAAEIQFPEQVVEFIASLFYLYQGLDSGHTVDEMVQSIMQFFLRDQPVESLSADSQVERFGNNLLYILNTNTSLDLTAKVSLIKNDQSHAYLQSKIYTDVRPLFGRSDAKVYGAVIIHTLKLSYQDGEQRKDFFVALDQSDLLSLRDVIERAEAKEATMREHSPLSGLRFFE